MAKFALLVFLCLAVGGMAETNTTCATCEDWTVSKQMGSTGGGLMFMLGFFACAIIAAIIFAVLTQMYPGFGSSNKMKQGPQQYYQPIPMNPYQQPFPMAPYAFKDAAGNDPLPGRVLGTYLSVNENNAIEARPLVWQP